MAGNQGEKQVNPSMNETRKGFVNKFAGSFSCHSLGLKDKKRPRLDTSSPEGESSGSGTGMRRSTNEQMKGLPLVDILKPTRKSDLLVSHKKVKEVENWLDTLTNRRPMNPPLYLILDGPSGSGKLTTIKLIAEERDMEIREYIEVNYLQSVFITDDDEDGRNKYSHQINNRTQLDNLQHFLIEANSTSLFDKRDKSKRLIVMKELPTTLIRSPEKYYELWKWYYNYFEANGVPVVFIITIDPARDQVKLFSSSIRDELNVHEIHFRPIVKTQIIKWLSEKLDKRIPKEEIDSLVTEGEGDIRCTINSIELKYGHEPKRAYFNHRRMVKKKRVETKIDPSAKASITISTRDHTLELYHYLGKILFCKRDFTKPSSQTLPLSLSHLERLHLIENPFTLYDSYQISSQTLILYLHQNYVEFSSSLENATHCIDWLSQADCLRDEVYDSDSPLEQYQSCLSVAGLMFNLSPDVAKQKHKQILSNRAWHDSQKKAKDHKDTIKEALRRKNYSIGFQETILDILPYVSMWKSDKDKKGYFDKGILNTAYFSNFRAGGYNKRDEPFADRQSTVILNKIDVNNDIKNDWASDGNETDDESHYIIEDSSEGELNVKK